MEPSVGQELEAVCGRLSGSKAKDVKVGLFRSCSCCCNDTPSRVTNPVSQEALKRLKILLDSPPLLQLLDETTLTWQHEAGQRLPGVLLQKYWHHTNGLLHYQA